MRGLKETIGGEKLLIPSEGGRGSTRFEGTESYDQDFYQYNETLRQWFDPV